MLQSMDIVIAKTPEQYQQAIAIQLAVFFEEQGIPEATCLEGNKDATHALALLDAVPIATARLLPLENAHAEIARVAVLPAHRGAGLGGRLVIALEEQARRLEIESVELHPHDYLEPFYERLGYRREDDSSEIVGGHRLLTMHKRLTDQPAP